MDTDANGGIASIQFNENGAAKGYCYYSPSFNAVILQNGTTSDTIRILDAGGWTFNNGTSDILTIDPTTGALGSSAGFVYITDSLRPASANTKTCGDAARYWSGGHTQTAFVVVSDKFEKTTPVPISEAEKRVAKKLQSLICKFKYLSAVELKGYDNARDHIGMLAQDLEQAFRDERLDPHKYAMFCSNTWYEYEGQPVEVDENKKYITYHYELNGQIIVPDYKDIFPEDLERIETKHDTVEVTRLGIRYDQLCIFIISAL